MDKKTPIEKWLAGELTEAEMTAFRQREDFEELQDLLNTAQGFKAEQFSRVDSYDSFRRRLRTSGGRIIPLKRIKPLLRIAAVFLIGMGIYYFFFNNPTATIKTAIGEKHQLELPDGSLVVLNAHSSLSYNTDNWNKERALELTGEAFFDVSRGRTFQVHTEAGTVTVLGTEFNVKQRGTFFEVQCFEGKVGVTTVSERHEVVAGEFVRYSGEELLMGKNIYQNAQWTTNRSSFQKVPLREVLAELQRQYELDVNTEGISLNKVFTGAFVHDNLESALEAICAPLGLAFELHDTNQVRLYTREK